jgi:hypothetical protein
MVEQEFGYANIHPSLAFCRVSLINAASMTKKMRMQEKEMNSISIFVGANPINLGGFQSVFTYLRDQDKAKKIAAEGFRRALQAI